MKLTIAIPTHNRARLLAQTLDSIEQLRLGEGVDAECLVVDNNSNDDTPAVVESFAGRGPIQVRRLFESQLGSSFARNRAIQEADCDFILFIDDDVTVEPDWARELVAEIERRNLDAACGLVLAHWPSPPPAWLGPMLYVKLAVHDPALSDASSDETERLHNYFSANVGFRGKTFERFGCFREDLGVTGENPLSGEDTELFARIIESGGRMGFASRAVVHHWIGPERLTRNYFRRKSFAFGVGSALKGGRSHNRLDKLFRNAVRMVAAAARGDSSRAFHHQLECVNFFGYWRGRLMRRDVPCRRALS
jgi:glycosyltransferase involved in cell wall biosynthesis